MYIHMTERINNYVDNVLYSLFSLCLQFQQKCTNYEPSFLQIIVLNIFMNLLVLKKKKYICLKQMLF